MRNSLRTRLLTIVLLGIVAITAAEALVGWWGLGRVRDLAIDGSTQALRQQSSDYLQALARGRASAIGQNLFTAQQLAGAIRDYAGQLGAAENPVTLPPFQRTLDGYRYFPGVTTTLMAPGDDDERMARLLAPSQSFEGLLPGLARQMPEIARVSYLMSFGAMRTYPVLSLLDVPKDWAVERDPAYVAAASNSDSILLWSDIRPGLGTASQVVSAIAPLKQRGQFAGGVAVDINLGYYNGFLKRTRVEQTGFAFLIDKRGRLIAAPEEAQTVLIGRAMRPGEQGTLALEQTLPSLKPALDLMHLGGSAVVELDMRGRDYLLAYAPIETTGWTLAVAAPVEEVTASTNATAARISDAASQTNALGLVGSVGAVALLVVLLSLVLRRQVLRPIAGLVTATKSIAAGELSPIAVVRHDEIGQLARSFNTMTQSLAASRAELTEANYQLERKIQERTADLNMAVSKLEQTSASQQELVRVLREISAPVIPVIDGVLAMPLVGHIDEQRAQTMITDLLERIERDRARTVLLDITGVPMIDTHVAGSLLQMVAASRLLGAEVVLVGVAPEVAQTLVALGIELRGLRTAADLRSAVESLLMRRKQ
jgi:anti-anti-sigma regulatory factor/HAMP domain-containing protein